MKISKMIALKRLAFEHPISQQNILDFGANKNSSKPAPHL